MPKIKTVEQIYDDFVALNDLQNQVNCFKLLSLFFEDKEKDIKDAQVAANQSLQLISEVVKDKK